MTKTMPCPDCDGKGKLPKGWDYCKRRMYQTDYFRGKPLTEICASCKGTGEIDRAEYEDRCFRADIANREWRERARELRNYAEESYRRGW